MPLNIKKLQEDLESVGLKPTIIDENTDFNSPEFQELGKKFMEAKHQEEEEEYEPEEPDHEDDAGALASAGFGTDEDYGYYGGDE